MSAEQLPILPLIESDEVDDLLPASHELGSEEWMFIHAPIPDDVLGPRSEVPEGKRFVGYVQVGDKWFTLTDNRRIDMGQTKTGIKGQLMLYSGECHPDELDELVRKGAQVKVDKGVVITRRGNIAKDGDKDWNCLIYIPRADAEWVLIRAFESVVPTEVSCYGVENMLIGAQVTY